MKRFLLPVVSVFMIISCASPRVVFDKNTDFSHYKTFAYYKKDMLKAELGKDYKTVIAFETDHIIHSKGLKPSPNPDLVIRIIPSFHKRIDIYVENEPWIRRARKHKSWEGTLTILLNDAQTGKTIWKTSFYLRFDDKPELNRLLDKKLKKAFEQYPPGSKH